MTHRISTEDPAPYGTESQTDAQSACRWTLDAQDGYWATGCNNAFTFIDGGPADNAFRFCPYCGRAVQLASDTADGTDTGTDNAEPSRARPAPPLVSKAEHQALLDQWNAIVRASGSTTHGGAVGHVSGLRRTLAVIQAWDRARQEETGRCALPDAIRTLIRQFAPRS